MMDTNKYLKEIENKLLGFIKKENLERILNGIALSVFYVLLCFFAINLLEFVGNFNSTFRTILFFAALSFLIFSTIYFFAFPFILNLKRTKKPDYYLTANKIGKHFLNIKDDLLNSLQLVKDKSILHSEELVAAAFEKVYHKSKDLNFNEIVNFNSAKKRFKNTAIVFGIILIFFIALPGFRFSAYRILNFQKEFKSPPKIIFDISPGNAKVTKGDDVYISIKTKGEKVNKINLAVKFEEQSEWTNYQLISDSLGSFSYQLNKIRNSFDYYAFVDDIESDEYKIEVINRPVINNFEVVVTPPSYAKQQQIVQKDNGNIIALLGSNVQIKLQSTNELQSAIIEFDDSTTAKFNTQNKNAMINFRIRKEANYKIILTDIEGNKNLNPITYTIKPLFDEFPEIQMIQPNANINIGIDNKLPLLAKIKDDYGFSKLVINYRLSASKQRPVEDNFSQLEITINKNLKEDEVYYTWILNKLKLRENDVVSYYLEIFDNDIISGPKSAKTSIFTIRVPSLDELLNNADKTQEQTQQDLQELLKDAKELNKELEKINNELKQDAKDITWEEKEKIEQALDKFEQLQDKVHDVQKNLSEMQKELQENNLLSKETMEKYLELQELLDELTSEEMKKAMEKLNEALKNLNRNNIQDQMKDFQFNEEMFQKSIERTLNLLKRIQIEQKIDELKKRTENIEQKQEELKEQTEKNNTSENNELSKKQDEITKDLNKFEQEMKELQEKMKDLKDMPMDEMKEAMDEFDKQDNQELSEEAQQQLQQMQNQKAMQKQQQIQKNMQKMQQTMQNLQSAMQQQNQMQTLYDMLKVMDNLLSLSKDQESLKEKMKNLPPNSSKFNEGMKEQVNIQQSLDKVINQINDIAQKTFAITPEIGKSIGKAKNSMSQSINAMHDRNSPLMTQNQNASMQYLNEAATLMKGMMDNMMNQSGQGSGMMSLMQQLQQLSQQQMNLNQLTQMLNQGQLTQEQMSQLQRLANEQQMIQKSLEQLNQETKESGQSKKLPSNLDEIIKEMKEVVTDMQTQKLDDNLVLKQERILSKLLDAQRSINERDFEKDRESNTGKNINRNSPPELILSSDKAEDILREELLRAMREGYNKDYQELIRKYFESLQKK